MNLKDFKKYFSSAVEIVKLNPKEIIKVAKDKDATLWGLIFVAIAGLATSIGTLNFKGILGMAIGYLIWTFIIVGIWWIIAKVLGGKAGFVEQYRAQSVGIVAYWLGVIPVVGPMILWLVEIWYLVMSVFIVKNVHKLKTWQAVVVVVVPIVVILVLLLIFLAAIIGLLVASGLSSPEALEQLQQLSAMR